MFFKKKNKIVEQIYQNIIKISRSKFFYTSLNLDDTFETRFDLIIFHAFLVFYFYKFNEIKNSDIPQDLFDLMFNDFENNLREMGFGDIAVNKKMKVFIKAFYGRIQHYNNGVSLYQDKKDVTLLKQAISNNVFKGKIEDNTILNKFVNYMIENTVYLNKNSESANIKNNFNFVKFY